MPSTEPPVVRLRDAALTRRAHRLWGHLDLDLRAGEFITVLGANGSGKTSLVSVVLGLQALSRGTVEVLGGPAGRARRRVGYVPQQRLIPAGTAMRGRDLVTLGVDGHRFGPRLPDRARTRAVDDAIEAVGAAAFADRPAGLLSGGEQQRLRVAQALVGDPRLLLCDEPLISLDLHHQAAVAQLVERRRRTHGTAVLFVTHDVNPVLSFTDRILYLAAGQHRLGPPEEVLTSTVLSGVYGAPVDVADIHGRIVVLGVPDDSHHPALTEVRA